MTGVIVTPSANADTVSLDWTSYNPWAIKDIDHFDIDVSDAPFTDVATMTPYPQRIGAETTTVTITGLTPFHDHYVAVVAVDVPNRRNPAVVYSATYFLSTEVISREASVFIDNGPPNPYAQVISREASILVPDSTTPAPVTGVGSGFTAVTSVAHYRAIDLDWTSYNELLQRDVVRYRVYVATSYFTDVTSMPVWIDPPYVPAGTQHVTVTVPLGNQTYYCAVVAEDVGANFNKAVASVSAQSSENEVWMPTDQSVKYNGTVVRDGDILRAAGTFSVDATAALGIIRVDFFVRSSSGSDVLFGSDTNPADGFSAYWDASTAANGGYVFTFRAYDNKGRSSDVTRSVSLNFNYAPVITAMTYAGANLAAGATLSRSGSWRPIPTASAAPNSSISPWGPRLRPASPPLPRGRSFFRRAFPSPPAPKASPCRSPSWTITWWTEIAPSPSPRTLPASGA